MLSVLKSGVFPSQISDPEKEDIYVEMLIQVSQSLRRFFAIYSHSFLSRELHSLSEARNRIRYRDLREGDE